MTGPFVSHIGSDIAAFLQFKHAQGHAYARCEFMLRSFERFAMTSPRRMAFPALVHAWLTRTTEHTKRKAITAALDFIVIRQFCLYRRRYDARAFIPPRAWAPACFESKFIPRILSKAEVLRVLRSAASLKGPPIRPKVYRALLLVLYCTGLRFGEACRLRIRDVDLSRRTLFIDTSKGRSRWVPLHASLAAELVRYMRARRAYARAARRSLSCRPRWRGPSHEDGVRDHSSPAQCRGIEATERATRRTALRLPAHLRRPSARALVPRGG